MTMREEFEHWYEHEFMGGLDGPGEWDAERNCYVVFQVHMAWKGYQAAYAAGQREADERAAAIADAERNEFMEQAGRNDGRQSDMAFGSVNSAERIAAAIRNRSKE